MGQATATQILDRLWLGRASDALNLHFLKQNKITHVVSFCNRPYPFRFNPTIHHTLMWINDDANAKFHFKTIVHNLETILNKPGTNVLVHCHNGISRSASVIIAYLMKTKSLPYRSSFEFVKHKRHMICPNQGFVKQLLEYEQQLRHFNIVPFLTP